MTDTINVTFIMPNGKKYPEIVDRSKTVERMLADFFEKLQKIHELESYSFMVNSYCR